MCRDQILYLQRRPFSEKTAPTILDTVLNPNIEKGKVIPPLFNLTADVFSFVNAGTDTSSHTLVVAVSNILREPRILSTLKAELRGAMPHVDDVLDWATLEQLPYLVSNF